jgi:hypothetical protein
VKVYGKRNIIEDSITEDAEVEKVWCVRGYVTEA